MDKHLYRLDHEERRRIRGRLAEALNRRSEVAFAYLYGSFAEGLPFHDLDVGVYVIGVPEEESTRYALDSADALSRELRVPVDVRVLNHAPVLFLFHVVRGELLLERDETLRSEVVERTLQRYFDLDPLVRRGLKEAFAA